MDIRKSFIQFIKFNIIGIANTLLTYLVYSLIVYLSDNQYLAVTGDYSVGIVFSYFLNSRITFKSNQKNTFLTFIKMAISYIPGYLLNLLLSFVFIEKWQLNKYFAQIVILGLISLISFVLQKYFVFKEKTD